jgi:putative flippase GtrA
LKIMFEPHRTWTFKCRRDKHVMNSHERLVQYITNLNTSVENLNKLFVLCVEFECYIDTLFLCMHIMDKRFFQ